MRNRERRACRRFAVPGASVSYRVRSRWPLRRRSAETGCVLIDLSRGGAAFVTLRPLRPGTHLDLEIVVPGDAPALQVRGRLVSSWPQNSGAHRAGVEFEPYGASAGDTPPAVLTRIAGLEARAADPADPAEPSDPQVVEPGDGDGAGRADDRAPRERG